MHPAEVGIDGGGSATAVWEERGSPVRTYVSERPAGGNWSSSAHLERRIERERTTGGRRRQGQAVSVWEQFNGELGEIVMRRRAPRRKPPGPGPSK